MFVPVRYIKGREALADIDSLNDPLFPLKDSKSSSVSGCAILLIRAFHIFLFKSDTIFAMTIPSNAIILPPKNNIILIINIFDENLKELYNNIIYACVFYY